jgi:hypothetical protein
MCYDHRAALHPIPHNIASLTVYFTCRKWKPNTARRKRSWTSLLRTWRVSNILLFQHDHYDTAMSIHDASLTPRSLSRNACGHSLILLLSYLHWGLVGRNKMNCTEFAWCTVRTGKSPFEQSREITKDAARQSHTSACPRRAFDSNSTSSTLPSPMFSQSSTFHTPDNTNDRIRPQLNHPASQSSLHASFSVGGVSSTTSTHHPHGTSSWASNSQSSTLPNSLNDPFLQSRSNYQSGYLMVCHLPH